jgi:hypothetical protein
MRIILEIQPREWTWSRARTTDTAGVGHESNSERNEQ